MHTRRIRKALSHFAADVTPRYRRDTSIGQKGYYVDNNPTPTSYPN